MSSRKHSNTIVLTALLAILSASFNPLAAGDCDLPDVVRRAAKVTPSARQTAWQELEFTAFIHFTVNAFTDKEWGDGTESPDIFNPKQLDCRQWARTCKDAGMKMMILTAKHHDGFCLWPCKYTDHTVASSPWKDGRGDIVREFVDACHEYGLKVGLYLSPWDRHEPSYGDSDKYNEYYRNQLTELLSNYGPIDEVWMDGACGEGPNGKKQIYDWDSYFEVVRKLQPKAVIFGQGPDVRWVGNEDGLAREAEWSVLNMTKHYADYNEQDCKKKDIGSREKLGQGENLIWYPAETDVSIRKGWFWHANEKPKTLDHLLDVYYKSVGRNSVLLLNLPPNQQGLIADEDIQRLKELRAVLDATFDEDLAFGAKVKASCSQWLRGHSGKALTDGKKETYWTSPANTCSATLEIDLGGSKTFNRAMLQECIQVGQRIEKFTLEWRDGHEWKLIKQGQTVGYKRLLRFDDVTTDKVRIRIEESRLNPTLSNFGLFYQPPIKTIIPSYEADPSS